MQALDKIRKARAALILDQPFFGSLALRLQLQEDPAAETMWTDGRAIGYNPAFVDTLTFPQVKGVLAHEVLHIANCHHTRRGNRDARR